MKLVFVSSAEWNPDNQIILKIAECGTDGMQNPATKRTIVLENVEEDDATHEKVVERLKSQDLEVFNKKVIVN